MLHSVTLIGESATLQSAVIGRRVEGKWRRWKLEKSTPPGEPQIARKAIPMIELENVFVLVYDFETKEHIPIEVVLNLVAENEVWRREEHGYQLIFFSGHLLVHCG